MHHTQVVAKRMSGVEGHSTVRAGDAVLRYGGRTSDREVSNAVYCMHMSSLEWRELRCKGYSPVGRCYHTADVYAGRMVVFGGLTAIGWDDVHFNNYNVFVSPDMLDPYDRSRPGKDRFRERVTPVTLAPDEPYCYHELDLLKTPQWTSPSTTGDHPEPRSHHTSAVNGNCLMIYGGYNTHSSGRLPDERQKSVNNVFSLNLDTHVWTRVECTGSIPPMLFGHSSFFCEGIFFTLGGVDTLKAQEEQYLCAWSVKDCEWRWLLQNDERAMGPRALHSTVLHGSRVVTFGGSSNVSSTLHADVHVFDIASGEWLRPFCTGEAPTARRAHSAVLLDGKMLVTGGIDDEGHRSSRAYLLDLFTWHWEVLSASFNATPLLAVADDNQKSRKKLEAIHAKRRKEKMVLMKLPEGKVRTEFVLQTQSDETPIDWGISFGDDPLVISQIKPESPASEVALTPGMKIVALNNEYLKTTEDATAILSDARSPLKILVERDESEVPPSPPSSEDEGAEGAPILTPSSMGAPNPALYTQTPGVPILSQPAALMGILQEDPRILSPRRHASSNLQTYGHNVFTASAAGTHPQNMPPAPSVHPEHGLGKYGFVDTMYPSGNPQGPLMTPPSPLHSSLQRERREPVQSYVPAHYDLRQEMNMVAPAPPQHPPPPKVRDTVRAWSLFPSASVKPTTNPVRTRYMSPSVVKLGMMNQLSINKPEALQGVFNGSVAAGHPYGRSMARDAFGRDGEERFYEGPENFVTTTGTAVPAGLGPISSAAFLTGMHNAGQQPEDLWGDIYPADPETLLSQMPVDIRNAAAQAYKDQWRDWSWEDRLQAVRRYAEFQARRTPQQIRHNEEGDQLPPVLPPPQVWG